LPVSKQHGSGEIAARLRLLEAYTQDIVYRYEVSPTPGFRYVSSACTRITGYSPEEHYADPDLGAKIVHPGDRHLLASLLSAEPQAGPIVLRWRHKDGHLVWTEHHCRLVRDATGQVIAIEGVARDVTARHEARQAHLQSETLNQRILEAVAAGVVLVAPDGSITRANPEGARILGLAFDELTRRYVADFATETIREDGTPCPVDEYPVTRCLVTGEPQPPATIGVRRPNGEIAWAVFTAAPLFDEEHQTLLGVIVTFLDVTEHKRAEAALRESEERLRQAQKMEAVGQLAGGIAHDFNNLLTAIIGFGELLEQDLPSEPGENEPAAYVREITSAAQRAADLTQQLLAFSRHQPLQPERLDLNLVVADMHQLLRRVIGEDIELVVDAEPALRPVLGDPSQLSQVLLNLAANARDAMPTGGRLTIQTANVELDEAHLREDGAREQGIAVPGRHVMLTVRDTGHGMDAVTRLHVFEPFFTTKEPGKGTGLGLATVYGIVKQSGGDISVESTPGQGATFRMYFPCDPEAVPASEHVTAGDAPVPRGTEVILVVEDEPAVRALASAVLGSLGYAVLTAGDCAEALKHLRQNGRIDLLLTDVVLPGRSGRELAEETATLQPQIRVLYMSGYTEDVSLRHGIWSGRVPFLAKPFSAAVLASKVREVLDAPDLPGL
jgi:PAS domain S-box-containing protein